MADVPLVKDLPDIAPPRDRKEPGGNLPMKASMQPYIARLKYATFSAGKPIDTRARDWLFEPLDDVFKHMLAIAKGDENGPSLLTEVFRNITYVVINCQTVSMDSDLPQGRRYTGSLANLAHLGSPPGALNTRPPQGGVEIQNRVGFYNGGDQASWSQGVKTDEAAERLWLSNWSNYLQLDADNPPETLGALHLGTALRPHPLFVSWFLRTPSRKGLPTPIAINIPDRKPAATAPAFRRFCQAFDLMLEKPLGAPRTAAILDRLTRHFGPALGASAFFSIPVTVGIRPRSEDETEIHELRAVISVALSADWNGPLYRAAWEFFAGVATQVIVDILVTDLLQHSRDYVRLQWEQSQRDSTYFVAHPLTNRISPLSGAADQLYNMLVAYLRAPDATSNIHLSRARAEELLKLADILRHRAWDAACYTSLLHLMVSILEWRRGVHAGRLRPDSPQKGEGVCLGEALEHAALTTTSKDLVPRGVTLVQASRFAHRIAPRLTTLRERHASAEPDFYRAIFAELLENAANYGVPIGGAVPVTVKFDTQGDGRVRLVLENLVHPDFHQNARDTAQKDLAHHQTASGMALAAEMIQHLELGKLVCQVVESPALETNEPALAWRYILELEPW